MILSRHEDKFTCMMSDDLTKMCHGAKHSVIATFVVRFGAALATIRITVPASSQAQDHQHTIPL